MCLLEKQVLSDREAIVFNRFLQILDYIDRKYVELLEEIVIEEAEIMSKDRLNDVDEIRLIGLRAMKRIIIEELGLTRESSVEEEFFEEIRENLREAIMVKV